MHFKHCSTTLTAFVLGLSIAACGSTDEKARDPRSATSSAAKPTLSDEAQQALARAEADVKQARAAYALWTTADGAMRKAREAADTGDSDTVIAQSRIASEQAKLGLAQKNYPTTEK